MLSATLAVRPPATHAAAVRPAATIDHEPDVTALILRWQSTGERPAFTALAEAVAPTVAAVAAAELRRAGRYDSGLVAEASSLVLDHLRRLHHAGADEPPVSRFRPAPGSGPGAGLVYVRWLARRRAADLMRSERRRDRRQPTFTRCFGDAATPARDAMTTTGGHAAPASPPPEESLRALADAAHRLGAEERALAESLLSGESQVEIARRLGVSAGTITRRRQRLLAHLAATMAGGEAALQLPAAVAAVGPTLVSFDVVAEPQAPCVFPVPRSVHSLYLHVRGRATHTLDLGGSCRTIDRLPGSLTFVAAGSAPAVIASRTDEPAAGIVVIIPPEVVASECRGGGADARRRLGDLLDFRDAALADLVTRLHAAAAGDDRQLEDRHDDGRPSRGLLRRLLSILGVGLAAGDEAASRLSAADQRLLVAWIDGHLDRTLPLEELAGLFRLSVGHFARKVRNTFRMCPSRVVQQRRALAAIGLMKNRERSLAALAAELGFSSQSHFTTTFRRHVGMTPAVFRHVVHGHPPATGRRMHPERNDFRAQPLAAPDVEGAWSHPAAAGMERRE